MALSDLDRESSTRRAPDFYQAYLNSSAWHTRRNRALREAGYTCQRCGSKRQPNVHHKSYERLGAENDSDLEVLCYSCHNGHHLEQSRSEPSGVYVKLVSQVVEATPFAQVADIADDTKRLCLKHKVPVNVALIDKAISLVCSTRLKDGAKPYVSPVEVPYEDQRPLTQAQSIEMLARLRRKLGVSEMPIRQIGKARMVTRHQADALKAFEMVTAEMRASIERCEALESEAVKP